MIRTLLLLVPVLLGSNAALAQDPAMATACETLLAARRIDATAAPNHPADEPGCRRVDRKTIGTVEQRALIGGAPYECMTIAGAGRCLWIVP